MEKLRWEDMKKLVEKGQKIWITLNNEKMTRKCTSFVKLKISKAIEKSNIKQIKQLHYNVVLKKSKVFLKSRKLETYI